MPISPEHAIAVRDFLVPTIEKEQETTRKVILAVPPDRLQYAPDERSMKAADLAWHIVSAEHYFCTRVVKGEFDRPELKRPEELERPDQIVAWYDERRGSALDGIRRLTPDQCARELNFFDVFKLSGVGFLQFMLNHSVHHRGQLSAYLRPMGAKVPAIYGRSGDEMPGRTE